MTKTLRADARRNLEALTAAARTVFARSGAEAPLDEVAREAGVGQATLYRRFPTREHLFVAILSDRVAELDEQARAALAEPDPWEALAGWLRRYERSATEYQGLSARVGDGLADDGSPMARACAPMKETFAELLGRARDAGVVRADITAAEVLALVSAIPKPAGRETIYLDVVLAGLRT